MSDFIERFERNTEGLQFISVGHCPDCDECPENPEDSAASFSWESCDFCGSHLGGDRHAAHAIIADSITQARGGEVTHFEVCTDCTMYVANGDLPAERNGNEWR